MTHARTSGPSLKVPWTIDDMPSQSGRTVLITGANDGLGFQLAVALAGSGARVIMACRNEAKAATARRDILARHPGARLDVVALDLGALRSVEACASAVDARYRTLDAIFCNAGIMAVPFGTTADGLELHMGVNYYGHFALVGRLIGTIRRSPGVRIVTTTSLAEKLGRLDLDRPATASRYNRWGAYADSKLAILMLALMLDERFRRDGIDAKGVSAHPGFARTSLRTTRLESETDPWQRLQLRVYEAMSMPAERGVLPLLAAATAPEIAGGEYVGLTGFFEIGGWPRLTRGQRRAYDPGLRQRLWERSEAETRVRF
jgi:NAD(P)-dependent dehydrogenase (short-subunit alcohol dehydrogenase family)